MSKNDTPDSERLLDCYLSTDDFAAKGIYAAGLRRALRDRERLDWLEANADEGLAPVGDSGWSVIVGDSAYVRTTLREAIDAARNAEPSPDSEREPTTYDHRFSMAEGEVCGCERCRPAPVSAPSETPTLRLTDEVIAEFWPGEDPDEIRRQGEALMTKLRASGERALREAAKRVRNDLRGALNAPGQGSVDWRATVMFAANALDHALATEMPEARPLAVVKATSKPRRAAMRPCSATFPDVEDHEGVVCSRCWHPTEAHATETPEGGA